MIPLSSSPLPIRRGPQTESQNRNNVRYRERGEGSASIASVPDTPRPGGSGTAAPRRRLDYGGNAIVIDDSESERDELASPEVRPTTTSRYFTQPTQVAPDWPKATLGSRGGSSLGRKSVPSPDVGSLSLEENEEEEEHFSDDEDDDYEDEDDETNKDPVEVPASSPFRQQEKSQQGPQPPSQQPLSRFLQGNTTAARPTINAFATLMAPPGTVFRAPARVNVPQPRPSVPPAIRKTIDLSSDEDERSSGNGRYGRSVSRKESSSDEDDEDDSDAARGNIVPSTFVKGQRDIQGQKTRQPFRQQPQPEQNGQTMGLQRRNESTSAPGRPEKRNKPALVARVREVLGDSVTTSEVVKTLNSCKWDVDEAVNILLSAEDPTNSEFSDDGSETGGSSRTSSPPVDSRMANFQSLVRSFSHSSSSQQRTSKVPGTKQSEAWPSISKGAQLGSRRGERLPEGENLQRNEQRPTLVKDLPLKNKSHTMSHSSIPQKTSSQEQDRAAMREGPAKRRRLVQGRRPRNSSPSQESFPISQRAYQENRDYRSGRSQETAITLDSSEGEAETYQTDDDDDRRRKLPKSAETLTLEKAVLKFLNKASADDIIAVSSCKRADAELMVSKQPFPSLPAARRAAHPAIANKKRKQPAGEAIVSSIQQFMTSLGKLEKYFKDCEDRGAKVQGALRSWNVDANGQRRESRSMKGDEDELHFEPEDILSDPPIARQPKMMDGHCEMKEYQLFGLNWMRLLYSIGVGCILADDMGLGKTCQVISFMCYLVEEWRRTRIGRRPWPNVIVVPPSTLSNWVAEFERFAPGLSVISYQGAQAERAEIAAELEENSEHYHVVLTTYTQVSREEDLELLQAIQPNVAVFDEGHKFKNPDTKVYKTFVRLRPNWRILLTGTPVQNNLMELVSLIRFLDPKHIEKYLADLEVIFSHRASLKEVSNGVILFGERIKRARAILAPFILQRSKAQVLKNFPPKVYRLVRCEMDEAQQRIYQSFQDKFKSTTGRRSGRGNDENNTWVQLRKSAIHSQLFRRFFTDEKVEKMAQILMANIDQSELRQPNLGHLIQELKDLSDFELHLWCRDYPRLLGKFDVPDGSWMKSGKVQELLKLLDEFRQNGDRVLVFSRFAKVIEILTECLSTAGHEHLVLKGETDVSERQDLINEFNNNPDITAFLLTTGAGGTGINLAAANKVIIFDQSDNPQDDIQAENRAHRLGQKREVEVIRLVSKGTIEEMVYLACRKKVALANQVVSNGDEEKNQAQESLEQEIRKMMAENEKAGRAALAADLDGDAELRETAVAVAASTSGATTASAADSGDVKKEIGLPSPGRGSETSVEREVIEIGSSRSTSVVSSSPSRH